MTITVTIVPLTGPTPVGKLADAEVHFHEGPLDGMKLTGFAVWETAPGTTRAKRNVTLPSRQYTKDGERRAYALLRPRRPGAEQPVRDLILAAYAAWEAVQ